MEALLTPEELAKNLNVPRSWIYEKTRKSEETGIPVIRIGKYCRFRLDDVLNWLKEKEANR